MKTTFDIAKELYNILNVPAITGIISGRMYVGRRPENSDGEDIVIVPLTNSLDFVQEGVVNINIYAKDQPDGTPNVSKLDQVTKAVVNQLESTIGEFIDVSPAMQVLLQDTNRFSYVNIRVEINIV